MAKNNEELKITELNGEELDQVTGGYSAYSGPCFTYRVTPPLVENGSPVLANGLTEIKQIMPEAPVTFVKEMEK